MESTLGQCTETAGRTYCLTIYCDITLLCHCCEDRKSSDTGVQHIYSGASLHPAWHNILGRSGWHLGIHDNSTLSPHHPNSAFLCSVHVHGAFGSTSSSYRRCPPGSWVLFQVAGGVLCSLRIPSIVQPRCPLSLSPVEPHHCVLWTLGLCYALRTFAPTVIVSTHFWLSLLASSTTQLRYLSILSHGQ